MIQLAAVFPGLRLSLIAYCLLLGASAAAQTTVAVSGHALLPDNSAQSNVTIRFELLGCANGQAKIDGIGIFSDYKKDFTVNATTGAFSGVIYPNVATPSTNSIDCNGTYGTTQYNVTVLLNGRPNGLTVPYVVGPGAFNLDNATPAVTSPAIATPSAVVINPSGTQTVVQPAGSWLSTNYFQISQYQDVAETAAPANPASGFERWFANSGTHLMSCLTSAGGNCAPAGGSGGSGTVTSVALALPNIFTVSGSPVTTSGTLTGALATQSANTVFAGPTSGVAATPAFRALVSADIPANAANTTGNAATATALAATPAQCGANNFATGIAAGGNANCTQPAFTNLSGVLALAQTPLTTLGDVLYANATPALARLAGQTSTTKEYLSQTGTGTVSAAPAWAQVNFADIAGTVTNAQLASSYSGVGACAASNWVHAVNANASPTCTQPAYSDLTGTPTLEYQTVQQAGVSQTQRAKLNFTSGVTCSDNAGAGSTDCSVSGGGLPSGVSSPATGSLYGTGVIVGGSPPSPLADYPFTDCSGATLTDVSGNGNNATIVGSPTWNSSPCSLTFGTTTAKYVQLPLAITASGRTFIVAAKMPTPANGNYTTLLGTDSTSGTDLLLYSTFDGQLTAVGSGVQQTVYAPSVFSVPGGAVTTSASDVMGGGWTVLAWVSDASTDHLYINGQETSFYYVHGGSAAQLAGHMTIGADQRGGGTTCSTCAFPGTVGYMRVYSSELSAADVARATQDIFSQLEQRGANIGVPVKTADGINQILGIGDSLTDGHSSTSYLSQLSGLSQTWTVTNFGVGSLEMRGMEAEITGILQETDSVNNARNLVLLWGGTNDLCGAGTLVNATTTFNRLLATTQKIHALGAKVIWLDMISRTGNGFGAATCDSLKDSYNALMRKWAQFGADGFVDLGEDTGFGADGTNSGASFNADHVHLTSAAQGVVAGYVSSAINMLENGPFMQPTVFTATGTMADSDFNAEGDTTSAAFTLTLPTCSAKTGYIYKVKNEPAVNTLTVHGNGSDLIDGSASFTLAQHASAILQVAVKSPASSGGCRWRKLN